MPNIRIGSKELLDEYKSSLPQPEVLGVVKDAITDPSITEPAVGWATASGGNIDMQDPPPPWVTEDAGFAASDARRFVDVPSTWRIRWFNPRLIEQNGWNYWKPISSSDPRVKVKVLSMVAPDGNIRRGGFNNGDVLCWMFESWYQELRKLTHQATAQLTQAAIDQQSQLAQDMNRGKFGPYIHMDSVKHPTHTMAEGLSMRRDP